MSARTRRPVQQSLSYHRLRDATVAQRIVASTGLAPPTKVLEFGAGEGMLTAALAGRVDSVVAIERDRSLYSQLKQRFHGDARVRPLLGDFLAYRLPPAGSYSIVSNPPYAEAAATLRKILTAPNPPASAFLVLQREAALKWTCDAGGTVAGICAQVRFTFEVPLALRRRDFHPHPRVASVLLAIRRRPSPLLTGAEAGRFGRFVERGFGRGKGDLRRNLGSILPHHTYHAVAAEFGFPPAAVPSELSFAQWLGLWRRTCRS
jgi:23S rRNA (adenine-N6)-dimethyltransferase